MGIDFNDPVLRVSFWVLTGIFLVSGISVVYWDITARKIPNALLMKTLMATGLVFALMAGLAMLNHDTHPIRYLMLCALNFGAALAVGYALYYFDLWSPGDGKYFPVLAVLVPLQCYTLQYVPWFPAVIILVNAYLLAFLVLFFQALRVVADHILDLARQGVFTRAYIAGLLKELPGRLRNMRAVFTTLSFIFYILSTFLMIQVCFSLLRKVIPFTSREMALLAVILVYLVGMNLNKVLSRNVVYLVLAHVLLLAALTFHYLVLKENMVLNVLKAFGLSFFTMGFLPIARIMVIVYSRATETVFVEDLRPGMALSADTAAWLKTEKELDIPSGTPLGIQDCQKIRDCVPNRQRVEKCTHITFGPYLFLGALFVMVFGRSVMHYLIKS